MHRPTLFLALLLLTLTLTSAAAAEPLVVWPSPARVAPAEDGSLSASLVVVNTGDEPAVGVTVELPLAAEEALVTSSPEARWTGAAAWWSLGTLGPGESAAIRVQVTGETAAPSVTASAGSPLAFEAAVGLREAPEGAPLEALGAVAVDADPTDPYVIAEVARLGGDPDAIVAWLASLTWHPYAGSLRGSRGALWARAGNAMDRASLAVSMLRAAGIPARYATATLSEEAVTALLDGIDVTSLVMAGPQVPPDAWVAELLAADGLAEFMLETGLQRPGETTEAALRGHLYDAPSEDSALRSAVQGHWWAQRWDGGAWVAVDPLLESPLAATETPLETPEAARHTVSVAFQVETWNPAFGPPLFGGDTVLTATFASAELVGRPLTLVYDSEMIGRGGLVFSSAQRIYTPILEVDGEQAVVGDTFMELATNFPLASTFILGAQLEVTGGTPSGSSWEITVPVADRLGAAARVGVGGDVDLAFDTSEPLEGLSALDVVTITCGVGATAAYDKARQAWLLEQRRADFERFMPLLDEVAALDESGQAPSEEQERRMEEMETAARDAQGALSASLGARYFFFSTLATERLAEEHLLLAYDAIPRVVATGARALEGGAAPFVDIAQPEIAMVRPADVPRPGQTRFEWTRGLAESELEGWVLRSFVGEETFLVDYISVFAAAQEQGVMVRELGPDRVTDVQRMPLPADAAARIIESLRAGRFVVTPERPVMLNGEPTLVWLERDPATGSVISTDASGRGVAAIQYSGILNYGPMTKWLGGFIGILQGFSAGVLEELANFLGGIHNKFNLGNSLAGAGAAGAGSLNPAVGAAIGLATGDPAGVIMAAMEAFAPTPGIANFISGFSLGVGLGKEIGKAWVQANANGIAGQDPPLAYAHTGWVRPWRRPLWRDDLRVGPSGVGPGPPPATATAGTVRGDLALGLTEATVEGALRVTGTGTVLNDGQIVVDTDAFAYDATALRAAAWSAGCDGDVRLTGADAAFACAALESSGDAVIEVWATPEGGDAPTWLRIEGATWSVRGAEVFGGASEVEVSIAAGRVALGPDAWDLTEGSWSSATGALSGAVTRGVSLEGAPEAITIGVGQPFTIAAQVGDTAGEAQARLSAPEGWFVEEIVGGFRLEPTGAAPGVHVVQLWVNDEGNRLAGGVAIPVTVTEGTPALDLTMAYDADYTTEWRGIPAQTVLRADLRNVALEAAEVSFEASAPSPFVARLGAEAMTVPGGGTGTIYVALRTDAALPAPGTPITVELTATAGDRSDTAEVTFPMPEVFGVATTVEPLPAFGQLGEQGVFTMTLEGMGNAEGRLDVVRTTTPDMIIEGVPEVYDVVPGQVESIEVPWMVLDTARVGFSYGIDVTFTRGEMDIDHNMLVTYAQSAAGAKARELAEKAGPGPVAEVLHAMARLFDDAELLCDGNVSAELAFRLEELATFAGDTIDEVLRDELLDQAEALDAGGCEALDVDWTCASLAQYDAVLEAIDAELGPRVFLTGLTAPPSIENGAALTVVATLTNEGDEASAPIPVSFSVRRGAAALEGATAEVPTLDPGASVELEWSWDTSAALGRYVVEAEVLRGSLYAVVEVTPSSLAPEDNRPPMFTSTPSTTAVVGEEWRYELEVSDPDGDPVFLSFPLLPRGFRLEDDVLVGRANSAGALGFLVVATDRYGASSSQAFEVEASFFVDNLPPAVASVPSRSLAVGQAWRYAPAAVDPDGDPTSWVAEALPAGAAAGGAPFEVTWTPTAEDAGTHWVALRVEDGRGGVTEHRFPLLVSAEPGLADLTWVRADAGGVSWDDLVRSGEWELTVGNGGGTAAGPFTVVILEGSEGGPQVATVEIPGLEPGASWSGAVDVGGDAAFTRRPLVAVLDPDDRVEEADESNNALSSVGAEPDEVYAYAAVRPTEARVVAVAAAETAFRLIDPLSGAVASEGLLSARAPTELSAELVDGDLITPLQHFAVEADGPLQVYVLYEIFDPDFGGDLIHPALDGELLGRSFVLYVPTATSNNRLVVTALEGSDVELYDANLNLLEGIDLVAGQTWEPTGLTSGSAYALESTGRLLVQSASVTGASQIPPIGPGRAATGDVGRAFLFSTRSRGADGGALAVIGYEDAAYEVRVSNGVLLTGEVSAGEVSFRAGFGQVRGGRLTATGDVALIAGDLARSGADRVELIGEDLIQTVGIGGRRFVVPTLRNDTLSPYVLAGPRTTWVTVNGETEALPPYGRLLLERGVVAEIGASEPVVVQTMGGGDRFFDYAAVARRVGASSAQPDAVLTSPEIALERCAVAVEVRVGVGNAGGEPISAEATLELIAVTAEGDAVVASRALDRTIAPGELETFTLEGPAASLTGGEAWVLRLLGAGPEAVAVALGGFEGAGAPCVNVSPEFVSTPPSRIDRGAELSYTAVAIDPEGAEVRYALIDGPLQTTLNPTTGRLRWQAGAQSEAVAFVIAATDPEGGLALQAFEVEVGDLAADCPPEEDGDDDGVCPPLDCDDGNPEVSPEQPEVIGDGLDNDCDPNTADTLTPSSVGLALAAEAASVAPGQPIRLTATLSNRSDRVVVEGVTVHFGGSCGGEALEESPVEAGRLEEAAELEVPFTVTDTAGRYGSCRLFARASLGGDDFALATVVVALRTGLSGAWATEGPVTIDQGELLDAEWTVTNTTDAPIAEAITVRLSDRAAAVSEQEVTLEAGASASEVASFDSTGWTTARVRAQLFAGDTLLAELPVDVMGDRAVTALAIPGDRAPEAVELAEGVAIRFQPEGRRPGGLIYGGLLQAAWWSEGVALRVVHLDTTEDDDDSVRVWLEAGGGEPVELTWTRAAGHEAVTEGEIEQGATLTFVTDQVVAPEEVGALFIEVTDARTGTRWRFAATGGDDPAEAAGAITFAAPIFAGDTGTPDTGMGDTGAPDTGVADTSPDAVRDTGAPNDTAEEDTDVTDTAEADTAEEDTGEGQDTTPDTAAPDDTGAGDDAGGEVAVVTGGGDGCGCSMSATPTSRLPSWLLVLLGVMVMRGVRRRWSGRGAAQPGAGGRGRAPLWLIAAVVVLSQSALVGCSDEEGGAVVEVNDTGGATTGGGGEDVAVADTGGADGAAEDTAAPDTAAPDTAEGDTGPEDTGEADSAEADTAPEDTGEPDTAEEDAGIQLPDSGSLPDVPEPEGAAVGESCEEDGDCESGICQRGVEMAVCTQLCDLLTCPDGFVCEAFPGGVSVCVAVDVCLDEDGDGYGRGGGCDGADCDEGESAAWTGAAEVCDGIDNNCDGQIDEGVRNACGGCGVVPEETCNGIDDDCDGQVDEGVANACGLCYAPREELCNGEDDDCDGTPDEGVCLDCELGEARPCYGGAEETSGVGVCRDGVQRCESGGWSVCQEQRLPGEEVCDGLDNDCDGEMDEGLLNACGECGLEPVELCDGEDNDCDGNMDEGVLSPCGGCTPCGEALIFPYEEGELDPSVAPAPDGGITLGTGLLERHDIWVPNSDEDTVSRWDTRTGKELARYYVGENPSRTAVDLDGNVWVGNRGDGIASHIYTDLRDCVDRNQDGVIQTSRDLNGDGRITGAEMVRASFEDPLADECVHCQVRVGNSSDLVRGVGVDADNFAWLGTWNSRELYKVDPVSCEIVASMATTNPTTGGNATPVYGLAIDGDGFLYTSSYTNDCVVRVDTREARVLEQICDPPTRYGMAAGPDGRIWYAGYNNTIISWDQENRIWTQYTPPDTVVSQTTGMVVDNDGRVYSADYGAHQLVRFDPEAGGGTWAFFRTNRPPSGFASQSNPRGVTIDAEGHVWGICRGSSGLVEFSEDGEWLGSYDIRRVDRPDQGTGPYSYSDNTGFQLFNIVSREGRWRDVLDLGAPVRLLELETMAYVPEGTSIEVQVRAGVDEASLSAAEWTEYVDAVDPSVLDLRPIAPEPAQLLEVRYRLRTEDPEVRPVLRDVQVRYESTDCRVTGNRCPSGQVCEPVYGGCVIPPRTCFTDSQCEDAQYCDETGACRRGCRLGGDGCGAGLTCDPETRVCLRRSGECRGDAECQDGLYCSDAGFCEEGCRLEPDSCPLRFRCEPSTRSCEPVAPECVVDADCDEAAYCGAGRCVQGCRLDGANCAEGERCAEETRRCAPLPEACDPEMMGPEVCDGLDNDCNGVVDDAVTDVGTTCEAGDFMEGTLVCVDGGPMCRANPVERPAGERTTLFASEVVDFSSQYRTTTNSALRALGPQTLDACAVSGGSSWAPSTNGADPEFLHLGFPAAMVPERLRVFENRVGGFVTSIDVVTADGDRINDVWVGPDETPCGEWLEVDLSGLGVAIRSVVIHTQVNDYEEINAVELTGETTEALPPFVSGTLEEVILPAAEYAVMDDQINVTGRLWMEDGVWLGRQGEAPWSVNQVGDGSSVWSGVELVNLTGGVWRSRDPLIIANADWVGTPGNTFDHYNGELVLLEARVTDVNVIVRARGAITLSRFETTSGTQDMLGVGGEVIIDESEFIGENIVPRRSDGIAMFSGSSLEMIDSTVRRAVRGVEVNSATLLMEGATLRDNDVGLRLLNSGAARITDSTVRLDDPGHVGVGVYMENVNQNAALNIDGLLVQRDFEDIAVILDPDFYQDGGTSSLEGLVVEGGDDTLPVLHLRGGSNAERVTVAPIGERDSLTVSADVQVGSNNTMVVRDLNLVSPYADSNVYLRGGNNAVLTVSDTRLEGVYVNIPSNARPSSLSRTTHVAPETSTSYRNMIITYGPLTVSGAVVRSERIPSASDRFHTGIYAPGSATLEVSDSQFESLRYGMYVEDNSTLTATDVTFTDCRWGIRLQEQVVGTITGMTVTDTSEALASVGLYLGFNTGGRAEVDGFTMTGDAGDGAIWVDPDVFSETNPSTFANLSLAPELLPIGLRGNSVEPGVRFAPIAGISTFVLTEDVGIRNATVLTVSGDVTLTSNTFRRIYIDAGARGVFEEGAMFSDVRVENYGELTAEGVTFSAGITNSYSLLFSRGAVDLTDVSFLGNARRQDGLFMDNGSSGTCEGCVFIALDQGARVDPDGALDTIANLFDDVRNPYDVTGDGALTAQGGTVLTSEDPAQETFGATIRSPADGLLLDLQGVSWTLDDNDEVLDLTVDAFLPNRTVAMSGSTFPNGVGQGYQVQGTVTNATVAIGMLEPAQPSWALDADVRFNGACEVTIAPGTVFTTEADVARQFDLNGTSVGTITGATFTNAQLRFDETATGVVTGSTLRWRWVSGDPVTTVVTSSGAVALTGNTFQPAEGSDTEYNNRGPRGVTVSGAATQLTLSDNTFERLRYGVLAQNGAAPTLSNNTFVECVEDTSGLP